MSVKGVITGFISVSLISACGYVAVTNAKAAPENKDGYSVTTETYKPKAKETKEIVITYEKDMDFKRISTPLQGVMKENGGYIMKYCQEYDVNQFLVIAIINHETDYGKSNAIKTLNNVAGIMNPKTGELQDFKSIESSVRTLCKVLRNEYFNKGLNTIEKIQKLYAPVGAANDPKGLNKSWLPNVTKLYNQYREWKVGK